MRNIEQRAIIVISNISGLLSDPLDNIITSDDEGDEGDEDEENKYKGSLPGTIPKIQVNPLSSSD